jgi:U2 small nuclear ribonucleoprotein B''
LRREGCKGQAWIIYEDVTCATAALQAEQGFAFFGKDLKIQFAKETSDRIAKRDGTYVPKAKRTKLVPPPASAAAASESPTDDADATTTQPSMDVLVAPPALPTGPKEPPSHILFAKDLPVECNEMMLAMLFRQYSGFKEVRIPRIGLAFVEFDDEPHATLALQRLNGFKLTTTDTLALTYGKA